MPSEDIAQLLVRIFQLPVSKISLPLLRGKAA